MAFRQGVDRALTTCNWFVNVKAICNNNCVLLQVLETRHWSTKSFSRDLLSSPSSPNMKYYPLTKDAGSRNQLDHSDMIRITLTIRSKQSVTRKAFVRGPEGVSLVQTLIKQLSSSIHPLT
jgi:hypothetical protein